MQKPDLTNHTTETYEVWVFTPEGAQYRYRDGLIYAVALNWTKSWNENRPADVPSNAKFGAVRATTTFEVL